MCADDGGLTGTLPERVRAEARVAVNLYRGGEHTISELEELFDVTRLTVYRTLRRAEAAASDAAA